MSPMNNLSMNQSSIINSWSKKKRTLQAARAGTRGFRAPEVLLKYQNQTTAVDIWSAGVILLSMLSKRYPFFHSPDDLTSLCEIAAIFGSKKLQMSAICLGKSVDFPFETPSLDLKTLCQKLSTNHVSMTLKSGQNHFPDEVFDLLQKLLDLNPFSRISAKQALLHPFFAQTFPS